MQIYKPSWHKIVSDNVLKIISKCFAIFSNVQIEVIFQLQCVCCPICKPLTVEIFQFTIHFLCQFIIWNMMKSVHEADMWHAVLGGNLPYSPAEIILLVVALTRSIHRAYCKKTLSVSPQSLDFYTLNIASVYQDRLYQCVKKFEFTVRRKLSNSLMLVFILNMAFLDHIRTDTSYSAHLDWAILLNWWCYPDIYNLSPHQLFLYWNIFLMSLDWQTP